MNEHQYQRFLEVQKLPLDQRKQMALTAQGEMQLILSYDPHQEVIDHLTDNPTLTPQSLISLVRRRNLSLQVIEKIAQNQSWISHYGLKYELIKNPHTPAHISLKQIKFLYRQELQKLSRDVGVSMTVRQAATSLLESRLADLLPGEKITLARDAVGPVLGLMLKEKDEAIIRAALLNPRVRENDVVILANRKNLSPALIREIYQSRWYRRYTVKIALANNIDTPDEIAGEIYGKLFQQDLQQVIGNPNLSVDKRKLARTILRTKILSLPREQRLKLARDCSREVLTILIEKADRDILQLLENNGNMTEGHMVSLAVRTTSAEMLRYLARESFWRQNIKVRQAIYHNPAKPADLE